MPRAAYSRGMLGLKRRFGRRRSLSPCSESFTGRWRRPSASPDSAVSKEEEEEKTEPKKKKKDKQDSAERGPGPCLVSKQSNKKKQDSAVSKEKEEKTEPKKKDKQDSAMSNEKKNKQDDRADTIAQSVAELRKSEESKASSFKEWRAKSKQK